MTRQTTESEEEYFARIEFDRRKKIEREKRQSLAVEENVITSYSIHYTKLYEVPVEQAKPPDHPERRLPVGRPGEGGNESRRFGDHREVPLPARVYLPDRGQHCRGRLRGGKFAEEDPPVLEQPHGEVVQRHDRGTRGASLPRNGKASQERNNFV